MPTVADEVAATLAGNGIEYIFGVPGSLSSVELIEAASKRGIRYILCSNESSAAVMAGVYSVLTNRCGVLSTGVGPGAAAGLHGVAHLWLERTACLVLTDRYAAEEQKRLSRQRLAQGDLYAPITKATQTLAVDGAAATIQDALDLALAPRPGPVHVDMPYDVMMAAIPEIGSGVSRDAVAQPLPEAALHQILDRLAGARRPAIIAGLQVNRAGVAAEKAVAAIAERLGAPVFATLAAKGVVPENHALAAGVFRGVESERALLGEADLILALGFDPVEIFTPGIWRYDVPVITLDEAPLRDAPFTPALEVTAPLASALEALASGVAAHPNGWDPQSLASYRKTREAALYPKGEGLLPAAVIRICREQLPDGGIVSVDAGQHKVLASDLWETRRPRGFHTSSGLGSMAVSLPAAIAAKLIEPATPSLCLVGDGGFLMRAGDLETAVRENLPIVVVVFNDRTLNLIKIQQDRRGYERLGTSFAETDFATVARGFGFEATRVSDETELQRALHEALASGRPWLIDALINPDGYA